MYVRNTIKEKVIIKYEYEISFYLYNKENTKLLIK